MEDPRSPFDENRAPLGVLTSLLGVDLGFFGYVVAFVVAYAVWEGVKYLRKKRQEDQGPPG